MAQAQTHQTDQHTRSIDLAHRLGQAYMDYAQATIVDRAIPDARDGLKPVQRRILYAMNDMGLRHDRPHKKSARIVGEVLGKYHPHGDTSVYDAMARMAQDFSLRDLLVDGQGNFGSVDGDSPAAMRYTEARMTELAETMLADIGMDTVDWQDNFDGSLQEPQVLPAGFPNLLVNGASGIAVGMSTNIPPHNLGEVADAVIFLAEQWARRESIGIEELMKYIPGPDFPTGGLLFRYRDNGGEQPEDVIRKAYETGRGRIVTQAAIHIESIGGGKSNIVVTQLPYNVQKTTVSERLAKEVAEGRVTGITDLRDESDFEGMRLVIEVSRSADPQDVLQQVLSRSQLRETFGAINLALVPDEAGNLRPEYLSLSAMLRHFIAHRLEVIVRRSEHELEKRRARAHVVEGLLKALDILDEVIDTIRRSRRVDTARNNLMRKFGFTEVQANAILDMQLRRLAALERKKLQDEYDGLKERIAYLEDLLASEEKRLKVVIDETQDIKDRFATPRRTLIVDSEELVGGTGVAATQADLMRPEEPQVLILDTGGLLSRRDASYSYRVGEGLTSRAVTGHLEHVVAEPEDRVLLFDSLGQGWAGEVGFVPEDGTRKALGLARDISVVGIGVLRPDNYLVMGTLGGKVKRTAVEDLGLTERTWEPVMGLSGEDDALLFADVTADGAHIIFYTAEGQLLRIDGSEINPQQTGTATGVAGARLRKDDQLIGGLVIRNAEKRESDLEVVVVSETGWAHRVPLSEFSVKGRNGLGVRCLRVTETTGRLGGVAVGQAGDCVDVYLEDGRRQRLAWEAIPQTARSVHGGHVIEADSPVRKVVILRD